jgi:hypothetical protein
MQNDELKQIIKVAKLVRINMKPFIEKYDYNFDSNYTGSCGIASYILLRVCKKLNLNIRIAEGSYKHYGHAFNVYKNTIVDITATQFGLRKPVHITKLTKRSGYVADEWDNAVIRTFKNWYPGLNPFEYKKEINKIINTTIKQFKLN